jgi:hypothetical protein
MAKKKKKEKKKVEDVIDSYTLDSALKTSKKTESTLHSLLETFSEDQGFISTKKGEERIEPQLSYEKKKKIAEDYLLEEVPVSERDSIKKSSPIKKELESNKVSDKSQESSIPQEEEIVKPITKVKKPSSAKKDSIYPKLEEFFKGAFESYNERYDQWENSISSILSILRKMRKITKKNTEDLVSTIGNLHTKIQYNLENFKLKRDQVEQIAGVDIESMSGEFKKVLGLLELQVKEYQFKRLTDEYVHQSFSS